MKVKIGDKIKCIKGFWRGNVTVGNIYTIIGLNKYGDPEYIDDHGWKDGYYTNGCFEIVGNTFHPNELIGKNVLYKDKPFKVEAFTVFNKYHITANATVKKEVKEKGYSYVLENDEGFAPFSEVTEIDMTVKISDDYTAVIVGDNVIVGCRTIPIQKVMEILEKHKKFS